MWQHLLPYFKLFNTSPPPLGHPLKWNIHYLDFRRVWCWFVCVLSIISEWGCWLRHGGDVCPVCLRGYSWTEVYHNQENCKSVQPSIKAYVTFVINDNTVEPVKSHWWLTRLSQKKGKIKKWGISKSEKKCEKPSESLEGIRKSTHAYTSTLYIMNYWTIL